MKKLSVLPLIAAMGLCFGVGMAVLAVAEPDCMNVLFNGSDDIKGADARGICAKFRNSDNS